MGAKWIIYENHIAIETNDEVLHPEAREIFELLSEEKKTDFTSPVDDLPEIHFSKVGSPIKCEVYSTEDGKICLELYTVRKGRNCKIDMIQGHIIDHCIMDGEWFYLNGDIETIQNKLESAGICISGFISLGQYIDLLKLDYFDANSDIENHVSSEFLKNALVPQGDVPKEINAQLYEYQKTGYLWMNQILDITHGCILGDEMGLGKTLQVITVFQSLRKKGKVPMLVVAPVSLLENWKRECSKFAPKLNVCVHHGSRRTGRYQELLKNDVVIISYNTAVSDMSMLRMIEWKCVVLDEAQNIKNPNSERARAVKVLNREKSIAVTGTPFENHITDIWSLVDFSVPGMLGTLREFERNIPDDVFGAERIEPLLTPIMIRRLVKDVANDLPDKVIIPQPIEMSETERLRYEDYRKEAANSALNGSALSIALLQKLRMYCTHPGLVGDSNINDPTVDSIKYQRFCEIVDEVVSLNEKIIVFTSYKKMYEIFKEDVPNRFKIPIDFINGDTPVAKRQKIIDWFNGLQESAMLVLNPKAAGVGLNITGANHVIHYNLEWNPSLEDQASARAYRRGQKKTVFIYRLYYSETVEQIVNERIERKREIASTAVIGNDGSGNDRQDILRALGIEINQ